MRGFAGVRILAGVLGLGCITGCTDATPAQCEEDPAAQVLEERVTITIAGEDRLAEIARTQIERDRGWRRRQCDREALVLLPEQTSPLPVWGCELAHPVDAAFVRQGEIVELAVGIEPCEPCGECPTHGDAVDVDAVVELPAGEVGLAVGDPIVGLPAPGS